MAEKNMFDYFYGSQSEQFSFFRLPKIIVRDEKFKKISSDAKILYGIMLDRMSLSRENHWVDDQNRVYIIFTLNEVMKEFECCKRKAVSLMAELDSKSGIGLIEKKKQGLGRPDLIYLKNFIVPMDYSKLTTSEETVEESVGKVLHLKSGKEMHLQDGKDVHIQDSKEMHPKDSKEMHIQDGKDVHLQEGKETHLQEGKNMHFQSGKEMHLQDSKDVHLQSGMGVQPNNTNNNNTDSTDTESINPINLNNNEDGSDMIDLYRRIVKQNICYDSLYENVSIMKRRMLDEIVELMVEVLVVNRKSMRIAGAEYPYPLVKSRFMCIGQDHVEYVLDCLDQTSTKIGNVKAYILTSLFNATATIDTYYTSLVHHDMVEGI